MAEGMGNLAQTGKKPHKVPSEGLSRGMLSLSKQDTEAIIEGLFKRLSESGALVGPQGNKTSPTTSGQLSIQRWTANSYHRPATRQVTCRASLPAPLDTVTSS